MLVDSIGIREELHGEKNLRRLNQREMERLYKNGQNLEVFPFTRMTSLCQRSEAESEGRGRKELKFIDSHFETVRVLFSVEVSQIFAYICYYVLKLRNIQLISYVARTSYGVD